MNTTFAEAFDVFVIKGFTVGYQSSTRNLSALFAVDAEGWAKFY